jgi:DNA-binding transcriptional MerR regulator
VVNYRALLTIGQLARRTGSTVRTIRFWSDRGLVPPTDRTEGGYRLYDAEAVARIDLVRTLRDLGLGLDVVERVLRQQVDVGQVVQTHAQALDAQIRALRLRRAVLRTIAKRASTIEEVALMHKLARLSARERQQIVDQFVEGVFAGIDPDAPGAGIASAMRQMPAELPDDPTAEQVDAWLELAELVQDPSFQARARQMAVAGAAQGRRAVPPAAAADPAAVAEHAGAALAAGVAPGSSQGKAVLDRIVPADTPAEQRARLLEGLETFTDARVERYWQLIGIINRRPPFAPMVPAFQWFIEALRAHG